MQHLLSGIKLKYSLVTTALFLFLPRLPFAKPLASRSSKYLPGILWYVLDLEQRLVQRSINEMKYTNQILSLYQQLFTNTDYDSSNSEQNPKRQKLVEDVSQQRYFIQKTLTQLRDPLIYQRDVEKMTSIYFYPCEISFSAHHFAMLQALYPRPTTELRRIFNDISTFLENKEQIINLKISVEQSSQLFLQATKRLNKGEQVDKVLTRILQSRHRKIQ